MERRKFIKKSCTFIGLGIIGPSILLESCTENGGDNPIPNPSGTTPFQIDLSSATYQPLNTVGTHIYKNGVIIANTSNGFVALSKACTHQGCAVSYNQNSNTFPCPCHGASFSSNGAVLGGPANGPLRKYNVVRNGNILTIS